MHGSARSAKTRTRPKHPKLREKLRLRPYPSPLDRSALPQVTPLSSHLQSNSLLHTYVHGSMAATRVTRLVDLNLTRNALGVEHDVIVELKSLCRVSDEAIFALFQVHITCTARMFFFSVSALQARLSLRIRFIRVACTVLIATFWRLCFDDNFFCRGCGARPISPAGAPRR